MAGKTSDKMHIIIEVSMKAFRWLALFAALVVPLALLSQSPCTDKKQFFGGNADPLCWKSHIDLQEAATKDSPALYNFTYELANQSDQSVTDIFWEVANVRLAKIPSKKTWKLNFNAYDQKFPHPSGNLNYDIGLTSYPTTIYAPDKGASDNSKQNVDKGFSLTSSLEIPRLEQDPLRVELTSKIEPYAGGHRFVYEAETNNGTNIYLFWQIPKTKDFATLEMQGNAEQPFSASRPLRRIATSNDPAAIRIVDVQIFDENHTWLATAPTTVFCSYYGEKPSLVREPNRRNPQ